MMTEKKGANEQAETASRLADITVINSSNPTLERPMMSSKTRARDPLMKRLFRWLVPDQRVANRHSMPPLLAYLGMARSSKEYKVGDISVAGFYMITEERWIPGTGFPVTLERTDPQGEGQTLTLYSSVVRIGEDGVGFTFVQPAVEGEAEGESRTGLRLDLTKLAQFLKGLPLGEPEALERAS
jgi:hypothetical protein